MPTNLILGLALGSPAVSGGGAALSAARWADEPAPAGYHWDYVIDDTTLTIVTHDVTDEPIVALVEND